MQDDESNPTRASRYARGFNVAAWGVLVVTVPGCALLPAPWGGGPESIVGTVMLPVFFVLVIAQLACGIVDGRRPARAVLLAALVAWGIGSMYYSDASANHLTDTATPGVTYYVLAYTLITVYLLTDVPRRGKLSLGIWLDAVIVAGGAACLAGTVLLVTSTYSADPEDAGRMVALLYPMFDAMLAGLVIFQIATRIRPNAPMSRALVASFLFLALSDAFLAHGIFQGMYQRRPIVDVTCGIGLCLLVWAACGARRPSIDGVRERSLDRVPITASVGASFIGMLVVLSMPTVAQTSYVMVPALLTMIAGQARMWLAIREARGASEARALSLTDELTGLPNRRALISRLNGSISAGRRIALVLLDLDGFKEINDGLGHNAGDTLLRLAARRVQASFPDDVLVARLGGDEFAIAVTLDEQEDVHAIAQTVLTCFRNPYVVDGVQLTVDGSIGIAVRCAEDTETDAVELLRRADVAMYQAKAARSGPLLYDRHTDEFNRGRLELVDALRRAIGAGHIEMWYQPQLDARTGALCGLEALVRWRHPTEGLIPPGLFLPAARRAGLMMKLTEEIVRLVTADVARWTTESALLVPRVAINVAPPELLGTALVPFLLGELRKTGLAPSSIVLEVTEDSFVSDPVRAREVLEKLSELGIGVSIDDYGTGFSSLAYLRDLPVEELKIDRSFIDAVDADERSRKIVSSTSTLAHALGMRVVAEGVETERIARRLVDLGVDVLQGFHLSKPLPFAEVRPWVEAHRGHTLPAQAGEPAEALAPAESLAPVETIAAIRRIDISG